MSDNEKNKKEMESSGNTSDNKDGIELNGMSEDKYKSYKPITPEKPKNAALEVSVEGSVERAMKVLKRKLIKEGLFKELKSRRYHEKPSKRKKRKLKESLKKLRKEESRRRKNQVMY